MVAIEAAEIMKMNGACPDTSDEGCAHMDYNPNHSQNSEVAAEASGLKISFHGNPIATIAVLISTRIINN